MIRTIFCMAVIYAANQILLDYEIAVKVGFNAVSLITAGVLGMPGVALLYGVAALPIL